MKIKVTVTKDDIRNGQAKRVNSCPVALALNRVTGQQWMVGVSSAISSTDVVQLPEPVADWIHLFDGGLRMDPIDFEVQMPVRRPRAQHR